MGRRITRHFVTIGGSPPRQVHYRRCGDGPLVLLLHQTPQSSAEFETLLADWGRQFTVVAPDTPGYGWSDRLPAGDGRSDQPGDSPGIDDLARAVVEFADAIGARRFGVYGFHTGASIGVALAALFPERITAIAANGLYIGDDAEIALLLDRYLPPLTAAWDGSHLAWLWARMREQAIFFPWHAHSLANRLDFDVPSPERLQQGVNEWLRAGRHYQLGYRAAFGGHAERHLDRIRVPALITASPRDPLAAHLSRIGPVSPGVRVAAADDADAALEKSRAWLAEHPGDGVPAPPTPVASAGDSYVVTAGRHLHVSRLGGRGPTTTLLVHGAGAAARQLEELTRHFVSDGPVLSPDLPGHGGSDPSSAGEIFEHCVTGLLDLLAHDDAADTRVIGCGSGASVAVEVARRRGCGSRLQLLDPPCLADDERADWHHHGLPEIRPAWHGGHLQEAWHVIRDSRLFFPWFRRERAAIRRHEPRLDVASIHGEVTDLLRAGGSWQALLARALDYPLEERLRGWTGPLWIGVTPTGTFAPVAGRWATRGLAVTRVSDDPAQWPAAPT